MKSINTHGLTIKGLRAACGHTADWPCGSGGQTDVYYDRSTGEIWTTDHVGNTYTQYDDTDVVLVCSTDTHKTMQQLADLVYEAVSARQEMEAFCAAISADCAAK